MSGETESERRVSQETRATKWVQSSTGEWVGVGVASWQMRYAGCLCGEARPLIDIASPIRLQHPPPAEDEEAPGIYDMCMYIKASVAMEMPAHHSLQTCGAKHSHFLPTTFA